MEEKKILTDEELDNVVGGMKEYSEMIGNLISHENGSALKLNDKINNTDYVPRANGSGAKVALYRTI